MANLSGKVTTLLPKKTKLFDVNCDDRSKGGSSPFDDVTDDTSSEISRRVSKRKRTKVCFIVK